MQQHTTVHQQKSALASHRAQRFKLALYLLQLLKEAFRHQGVVGGRLNPDHPPKRIIMCRATITELP